MAEETVTKVAELLVLHAVTMEISTAWGLELVQHCPSCGYIDEEMHTANIVVEYLHNVELDRKREK